MAEHKDKRKRRFWWRDETAVSGESCAAEAHPGEPCPACGQALLAYDSLFILCCPACGYVAEHGVFT